MVSKKLEVDFPDFVFSRWGVESTYWQLTTKIPHSVYLLFFLKGEEIFISEQSITFSATHSDPYRHLLSFFDVLGFGLPVGIENDGVYWVVLPGSALEEIVGCLLKSEIKENLDPGPRRLLEDLDFHGIPYYVEDARLKIL